MVTGVSRTARRSTVWWGISFTPSFSSPTMGGMHASSSIHIHPLMHAYAYIAFFFFLSRFRLHYIYMEGINNDNYGSARSNKVSQANKRWKRAHTACMLLFLFQFLRSLRPKIRYDTISIGVIDIYLDGLCRRSIEHM